MKVLKIEIEGLMTSFRYPHFLVGRQPSYPAPPPATIYGHLASAMGEHFTARGMQFAYCFEAEGRGDDLETTYLTWVGTGKAARDWKYAKNVEAQSNVFKRELLLLPRMTLYIAPGAETDRWLQALREPAYPVILGRSQDLCAYRSVTEVELTPSETAYFDPGLLPWEWRPHLSTGSTLQMPRFIYPDNRKNVDWHRYVFLNERVWWGNPRQAPRGVRSALQIENSTPLLIDRTSPECGGAKRAVILQSWVDDK